MTILLLCISALCLLDNGVPGDTCSDAIEISEGTTYYDTFQNTDSGYSPDSTCELMGIMYRDVWFSYTPTQEEVTTVSTCNSLSFDTSIIVYERNGDCGNLSYLTCSGDAPSDSECQPYHSVVAFDAMLDTEYIIRIGGWDENSLGSGSLLVSGPQDPPDTCPTDINDDAVTNVTDVLEVISQWGPCFMCSADFDENGMVDIVDFLEVIGSWGACPMVGTWEVFTNSPVAPYLHHDDIVVRGNTIWICNVSGEIWKSIDDGESWTLVCYQEGTSFRCLTFIDDLHGWAGNLGPGSWVGSTTDTNPIYETVDGGLTWTPVPFSAIQGEIPDGICGIHAVDRNNIFGAGRYAGGAYVISSTDGGNTWVSQNLSSDFWTFVDVYFETPLKGYITGANNQGQAALLYTEDGGASWTTRITNYSSHYWKMGFASSSFGYAVCSGGTDDDKWVQTYDGGKTWNESSFTDGFHANGIGFLNDQVGWIGGYPAETLQTLDGGETWSPIQIDLSYGDRINRFEKVSEDVVYAVGNRVYKYSHEAPLRNTQQCDEEAFNNSAVSITAVTQDETTSITYTVPEDDHVTLTIFIRGSLIYDRPVDEFQRAGLYTIEWKHPKEFEVRWEQQNHTPELFVSIQTGLYRQWVKFKTE